MLALIYAISMQDEYSNTIFKTGECIYPTSQAPNQPVDRCAAFLTATTSTPSQFLSLIFKPTMFECFKLSYSKTSCYCRYINQQFNGLKCIRIKYCTYINKTTGAGQCRTGCRKPNSHLLESTSILNIKIAQAYYYIIA